MSRARWSHVEQRPNILRFYRFGGQAFCEGTKPARAGGLPPESNRSLKATLTTRGFLSVAAGMLKWGRTVGPVTIGLNFPGNKRVWIIPSPRGKCIGSGRASRTNLRAPG